MRVGRRAGERGERVASDIEQQHRALADKYNITLEQLHQLLDDPAVWRKFQTMMSGSATEVQAEETPPRVSHWSYVANGYRSSSRWKEKK